MGIVNGTKAYYHSLTPADANQKKEMLDISSSAGRAVTLTKPPETVNIEIPSLFDPSKAEQKKKHKQWVDKFKDITLVPGKVVIPIKPERKSRNAWKNTTINGSGHLFSPSKSYTKSPFPLMPGFAVTVHKAQGMTLDNVILSLGLQPANFANLNYEMLYVAFSWVKDANSIRVLLLQGKDLAST